MSQSTLGKAADTSLTNSSRGTEGIDTTLTIVNWYTGCPFVGAISSIVYTTMYPTLEKRGVSCLWVAGVWGREHTSASVRSSRASLSSFSARVCDARVPSFISLATSSFAYVYDLFLLASHGALLPPWLISATVQVPCLKLWA